MEIPTMGNQPIILGGFYSEVEDSFLPGLALWKTADVEKYKTTIRHPKQETRQELTTGFLKI